jgi:hypothetical protein
MDSEECGRFLGRAFRAQCGGYRGRPVRADCSGRWQGAAVGAWHRGAAVAAGADDGTAAGEGSSSGDPILDFYQCLRDGGLDVQDPGAGGAINLDGLDPDDPATRETIDECAGEHMASSDGRVTVGDGQMGDNLAEPDALIAFVDCMRDEGIDMPDPSPDGRLTLPQNVDPQDPAFQNAGQQCSQHLDGGGILMGDGSGGGTVGQRP